MLDITQLNYAPRRLAADETSEVGQACLSPAEFSLAPADPKPQVTWRVTRFCNLNCLSCTSDSRPRRRTGELSTAEGRALIDDLAAYRVHRLLFAGGEPLLRADLVDLVAYARERGIEPALFTNGTLLTLANAQALQRAGLHSASILLEGIGREVDRHRGSPGAYHAILEAHANCAAAGLATEIRTPLSRWNYSELSNLLDWVESRKIRKVVFAHLVYAGRGNTPQDDMSHEEKRRALDLIFDRAQDFQRRGVNIAVATDENHADAIYLFLRLAREAPERAAALLPSLRTASARVQGAGVGQAGIDSTGDVHPDAYWTNYILGNVREIPFSEIWETSSDPLLRGLRHRLPLLKGRCANCRWKQTCGGNLRVRAEQVYGDPWMSDSACYLTNKEIIKEVTNPAAAMEYDVLLREQAA